MISQKHRQYMLLGGLLLILVIVVTYQLGGFDPPATTRVAPSNSPAQRGTTATSRRDVPVTDVKLDLLQAPRQELPGAERNPFRFKPKPQPPAPAPVVRNAPPPIVTAPVPTGPPPPPPIPLRVIGVIDAQPRVSVLSDGRGNVFYGKEGDIIDGRYRVLRIGPDSAELSYPDGRGRQTLRMSGQ